MEPNANPKVTHAYLGLGGVTLTLTQTLTLTNPNLGLVDDERCLNQVDEPLQLRPVARRYQIHYEYKLLGKVRDGRHNPESQVYDHVAEVRRVGALYSDNRVLLLGEIEPVRMGVGVRVGLGENKTFQDEGWG